MHAQRYAVVVDRDRDLPALRRGNTYRFSSLLAPDVPNPVRLSQRFDKITRCIYFDLLRDRSEVFDEFTAYPRGGSDCNVYAGSSIRNEP